MANDLGMKAHEWIVWHGHNNLVMNKVMDLIASAKQIPQTQLCTICGKALKSRVVAGSEGSRSPQSAR